MSLQRSELDFEPQPTNQHGEVNKVLRETEILYLMSHEDEQTPSADEDPAA